MAGGTAVQVNPAELTEIVESVFQTMLNLEAERCPAPWYSSGDRLTAFVHLLGGWNGAVLLECSRGQACRFAGRFVSAETPRSVDDVVRAVLAELANMIGGNLKCVIAPGIHLSMPSVVDGDDYSLLVCGAKLQEQLAFECSEGLFWVTVMTQS